MKMGEIQGLKREENLQSLALQNSSVSDIFP
jgi:hypothetical protein